jgi:hypothetical protein
MSRKFVVKKSKNDNKISDNNLPKNPYDAYINSLEAEVKAPKTIIEAKYVIKRLQEAKINLYSTDIDELTAYLAKIKGKEIKDWETGEPNDKKSYVNRATHRKVIVKIK